MEKFFINYRTADAFSQAVLLDQALSDHFGSEQVFRAGKSITPGDRFGDEMLEAVRNCSVLLAVIGQKWLSHQEEDGTRSIDDPADWVRREILEAFAHGIRVIPVLFDTGRLQAGDLPPELVPLAERHDVRMHLRDNHINMPYFLRQLEEVVPGVTAVAKAKTDAKSNISVNAKEMKGVFNERVDIAGDFNLS
ncbi:MULTISPECIES: toll/interleukin-1 receptor domain-containing protein [unclassified Crossiella]|uniref:toll/interleukin-1 receptor domain-containing protein n=1 Tax=unclassified Crossiella TaxID=2620835 RepID=UPI001FFFA9FF|nr:MULTISPECIES: toll/interleukin-1 receptor domain-containing protein [unclassified Crossiella]MCK2243812.1 toll/interleukin-1 receptor domain-containing protein [Crossiella sp. S99.2]MCK2257671.1 toll/interleukin-1 receptor domain-containing protein [Crossiella sp. S99.1]